MRRKRPKRHVDAKNKNASAIETLRILDNEKEPRETEVGALEVEEAEISTEEAQETLAHLQGVEVLTAFVGPREGETSIPTYRVIVLRGRIRVHRHAIPLFRNHLRPAHAIQGGTRGVARDPLVDLHLQTEGHIGGIGSPVLLTVMIELDLVLVVMCRAHLISEDTDGGQLPLPTAHHAPQLQGFGGRGIDLHPDQYPATGLLLFLALGLENPRAQHVGDERYPMIQETMQRNHELIL